MFTVLADGVLLVGQAAEVHENCRFVFADAVSHCSMLGPLDGVVWRARRGAAR